jgi:hypothetical protein
MHTLNLVINYLYHVNIYVGGMEDPYVLIQYQGQEKRSNIAKGLFYGLFNFIFEC